MSNPKINGGQSNIFFGLRPAFPRLTLNKRGQTAIII